MARPVLAAVAEQQKQIDLLLAQNKFLYNAVNRIATVAGLRTASDSDDYKPSHGGYPGDVKVNNDDDDKDSKDDSDGRWPSQDESGQGVNGKESWDKFGEDDQKEARRRRANAARRANFRRQADEENPANPIPDPSSEAPYSTTEQTLKPGLARGDVSQIGGVPGATNVSADATTTVDQIGGISADQGYNINEDVTKPISGTEGPLPLDQVRTLPNIEFGNPLAPEIMFPLEGEWANKVTLGSQARTYASLRLARLRMEAGIADPQGDDLVLGNAIQTDASLSDGAIHREIETLSKVISVKAAPRTASRRVAPKNVERTTPSFSPGSQVLGGLSDSSDDGAFAFE